MASRKASASCAAQSRRTCSSSASFSSCSTRSISARAAAACVLHSMIAAILLCSSAASASARAARAAFVASSWSRVVSRRVFSSVDALSSNKFSRSAKPCAVVVMRSDHSASSVSSASRFASTPSCVARAIACSMRFSCSTRIDAISAVLARASAAAALTSAVSVSIFPFSSASDARSSASICAMRASHTFWVASSFACTFSNSRCVSRSSSERVARFAVVSSRRDCKSAWIASVEARNAARIAASLSAWSAMRFFAFSASACARRFSRVL